MRYLCICCCVLFAGSLLLACGTGCSRGSAADVLRTDASAGAPLDRVTAGPPQRKTLRITTTQPGRIEAFEATPLYPKITGYVDEVLVDIGDKVEKDEVLVRLRVPELLDDVRHKEALISQAEAEVQQAAATRRAAEAALATARARVAEAQAGTVRAEADYERWKSEFARISDLVRREAVTPQVADEKLNQFAAADAARQEAAARVELASASVEESAALLAKTQADLEAAGAKQRVAQADLAHAGTMLAYTEIKAPFAGVVTRRHVDPGHYVRPATGSDAQPLLTVVNSGRVRIFIDVPETLAALVEPGDSAVVRVQALGSLEFTAEVTRTSWAIDTANRSLNTEIDLDNPDGLLRPGMYATAEILLELREGAATLPVSALVQDAGQACCFCIEAGKLVRTPVSLGLRSGDDVEILSGLEGSELVVLARADSLHEGQAVEAAAPEGNEGT